MPVCPSRRQPDERGFTLLELMVVILIIAILLAIAIPTFLGVRTRAQDRAAQSDIRNGYLAELIVYADNEGFTDDIGKLRDVDTSLSYTQVLAAMVPEGNVVYVEMLADTVRPNDTVLLGGKSASGRCFWIRSVAGMNLLRFADNDCSAIPPPAAFRRQW